MHARFASSYIDQLFARKDLEGIHHLISTVSQARSLPEEFWLFRRMFELFPSRSGIWQYYEGLPDVEFQRLDDALERYGFHELARRHRLGRTTWNGPSQASEFDAWLDENAQVIHAAALDLIAPRKDRLKHES